MKLVIWNKKSGVNNDNDAILDGVNKLKESDDVVICEVEDLLSGSYKEKVDTTKLTHIVAIGGDGTVNISATKAVQHDCKLVVIPAGTFNHFAKHNDLSLDIPTAFEVFENGQTELIDIGKVNDTYFCNFVSVGFYADVIHERVRGQKHELSKWPSFLKALIKEVKVAKSMRTIFELNETEVVKKTPLVFVGNGKYEMGSFDILNNRQSLKEHCLQVLLLKDFGKVKMLAFMLAAMSFDATKSKGIESISLSEFSVHIANSESVAVSLDGEAVELSLPLKFKTCPSTLQLVKSC